MTDKKSSTILIYSIKDTVIYTENKGVIKNADGKLIVIQNVGGRLWGRK